MTVVVPVFNRGSLICRCLDSLRDQTWRPIHIIVVDNASTDATIDRVSEWQSSNCNDMLTLDILSDSRRGAAYARQTGLENTSTDKVMFFDSDDVMRPDCVATVMKMWERCPDVDIITWPVAIHQNDLIKRTHSIKGNLLERHLVHTVLRTQGYAIKADFLRDVGGWHGIFPNWNDLETGTRVLLASPKVIALDDVYADVYHQKESITGESFSDKYGKWEISLDGIEKTIRASVRSDQQRLLNIISYRRAILAAHYAKEGHPEFAQPLYHQALKEISVLKRVFIKFAYHWTRRGMRGAFSLVGKFL